MRLFTVGCHWSKGWLEVEVGSVRTKRRQTATVTKVFCVYVCVCQGFTGFFKFWSTEDIRIYFSLIRLLPHWKHLQYLALVCDIQSFQTHFPATALISWVFNWLMTHANEENAVPGPPNNKIHCLSRKLTNFCCCFLLFCVYFLGKM